MKRPILFSLLAFCCLSFVSMEFTKDKSAALTVLEEKCNVCHVAKKRVVFTNGNMETHAKNIHKQVFIKKRMPKGKKFPMTEEEYDILKKWLATVNIP